LINEPHVNKVENIHNIAMQSEKFKTIYEFLNSIDDNIEVIISNNNEANKFIYTKNPPQIIYNFINKKKTDFLFKSELWVYIEEMCHAYEYVIGGESLSKNQLGLELYVYNEYIEPILKEIDPYMYDWDNPSFKVYTLSENYNKYGEVVK